MPTVELPDFRTPQGWADAHDILVAYMAWPDDADARRLFLAVAAAERLACAGEIVEYARGLRNDAYEARLRAVGSPKVARREANLITAQFLRGFDDHLSWAEHGFSAMRGMFGVIDAPSRSTIGEHLQSCVPHWLSCGLALHFLWQMTAYHNSELRGGASISKAFELEAVMDRA